MLNELNRLVRRAQGSLLEDAIGLVALVVVLFAALHLPGGL